MNKKITYISVIVIIAAIVSAAVVYVALQNPAAPVVQNIALVDDEGFTTTLNATAQRVVSLAPSNTQIVFAIGEGSKVVGVTDYDNYPYNFSAWIAAGNMTSIGGFSTPNKEAIASLRPDLILATPINDADVVTLRSLGYNVLVLNPTNLTGILANINLVGKAVGAENAATNLVNNINSQVNAITAKIATAGVAKPKVYYEIWGPPAGDMMSAGGTSWVQDIIDKAGGINIFANETGQWPTVSSETVVQQNPDVIMVPTGMGGAPFYGNVSAIAARPGWSSISAVQNHRIVVVDGDLFAETGPRIADQIQAVAAALYPSLFTSPYISSS